MSNDDKPAAPPSSITVEKGYQPKPLTEGYKPTTGQGSPTKPPSNPPNQNTGGSSDGSKGTRDT